MKIIAAKPNDMPLKISVVNTGLFGITKGFISLISEKPAKIRGV